MSRPTHAATGSWPAGARSSAGVGRLPADAGGSPAGTEPDGPRRPGAGSSPRPWRRRLRGLALWVAAVATAGLLLFLYHYLAPLASGQPQSPLPPFISELTGAFCAGLLFFPIRWLVRRLPLTSPRWPRRLPVYLLAMLASGAIATTLMWGLRSALFPLAGLGAYDYGVMPLRYLMELPLQVIWFSILVAAIHGAGALQVARERELATARIESSLARAQLRNLRLQLQPHFLFNALNTISAAMYDDPAAADEMLDQLAELLRASLRTAQSDEVPLGEELALLDRYVAIQRARFGDRLAVSIQADADAASCLVPSLLLQPLVENAIRHGNAERTGRGAIAVRARREGERLLLEVEDDGPGIGPGASSGPGAAGTGPGANGDAGSIPSARDAPAAGPGDRARAGPPLPGLGLAATAERLQLLYGDGQSFCVGNGATGGFLVRVTLPARHADLSAPGPTPTPAPTRAAKEPSTEPEPPMDRATGPPPVTPQAPARAETSAAGVSTAR
jgi:two-component system, LytTR family, sensor kinase